MTIQEEIKALESLIQHGKNTGQEQGVWMERLEADLVQLKSQLSESVTFLTEEGESF